MALIRLELTTTPFEEGRAFGNTGPYELLEGTAHFGVEPANPLNQVITDLELAPVAEDGLVHFSADFSLLRPADPFRGNHRLLLDVPNRGRKVAFFCFSMQHVPFTVTSELEVRFRMVWIPPYDLLVSLDGLAPTTHVA